MDYAIRRLEKKGINNVEYNLGNGTTLDFADEQFDRIFMVTVIGEVADQHSFLKEAHRVLKPNGFLSISELAGDPDKLSSGELEQLVCSEGFKVKQLFGTERNYTMNFEKA